MLNAHDQSPLDRICISLCEDAANILNELLARLDGPQILDLAGAIRAGLQAIADDDGGQLALFVGQAGSILTAAAIRAPDRGQIA